MKKKIISLCLALCFVLSPASAAFTDISDPKLSQAAAVLDALDIMQGVGGGRFAPSQALTRAQFCKLAVTAMGCTDADAYGNYTIFPDVKHTHWAAKYINAAVRHPELKDYAIIRGYADGTFGPDKSVTFGEVCTMLLRMLGYTEKDVGPFWPEDYIARAKTLGLTNGVQVSASSQVVSRSDAAMMLLNTLGAQRKGEGEGTLLDRVASATVKNCVLLATSDTDHTLASNEAIFFEDGSYNATPRRTAGKLDRNMIGVSGTLVIGKSDERAVVGVVPNGNATETLRVESVAADQIHTDERTLRPDRNTMLYVTREGKADTYANLWSSLQAGDSLTLYYDAYGALQLMAVLPDASASTGHTFVYGVATSVRIPQDYVIRKNGVQIEASQIKKYDVVTLDSSSKTAFVSDNKLTGLYESGTPSFNFPQSVTVMGKTYSISDSAAATFAELKVNQLITLLFDASGRVAAAYPKSAVSAEMMGIVTRIDEGNATVSLINGMTVQVPCDASKAASLMGRFVTVNQSTTGTISMTKKDLSRKVSGEWDIAAGKLGTSNVSPSVAIYEEVDSGAPLYRISTSDLSILKVPSTKIRYTLTDNAGTITTLVLGDVTGESWQYGIGYVSALEDEEGLSNGYKVTLRYWDGSKQAEVSFDAGYVPSSLGGKPIGISKAYANGGRYASISSKTLTLVDTVSLNAFDGSTGVRTKQGYYDLADNVGVYISDRREFISLQSAKLNYTQFRVYANGTAEEGGKIRLIMAS